jgi:hypothetical protein
MELFFLCVAVVDVMNHHQLLLCLYFCIIFCYIGAAAMAWQAVPPPFVLSAALCSTSIAAK